MDHFDEPYTIDALRPTVPPLRTWSVTGMDHSTGTYATRTYEAHAIDITEAGILLFIVCFLDMQGRMVETPRYIINAMEWSGIEEQNPLFVDARKH
jgi:hypothetical protein